MPQRNTPDDDTIIEWHLAGVTYREMADRWNATRPGHDPVTESAFNMKCRRLGLPLRQMRHEDLIPWTPIRKEHNNEYMVNMLRREGARRAGAPRFTPGHKLCDETDLQRLNSWIQGLHEGNKGRGVVVHYDPETLQGWHYVNRVKADKDIIRTPEVAKKLAERAAARRTG